MPAPSLTPRNPYGVKIPAAEHGAQQLPIPQPATQGEADSYAFAMKLKTAASAQLEANCEAYRAGKAREAAKPYAHAPNRPGATDAPDALPPGERQQPSADTSWDDIADSLNRERGVSRPAHPYAAVRAALTPTRE